MIGKRLKERYDILETIGSGGMATVYLAYCNYLKRNVAIKRLTHVNPDEPEDPLSFEAKAIARVSHNNIVAVYDMFEEDGQSYIVMEYVKGATLKEYIHTNAPLDEREIINLASKLASALHAAHTSGVIHRDIKPENIILDPNGEPKLTDFGIAHVSNEGTIVRSDQIFGSLRYASPEQLKGNIIDERSDIYSLGVVLYEMATGRMPFPDESPVTAAFRKLKEPLPGVRVINPRISTALEQIILRATAIEPGQRYHSMLEMYMALQQLGEPSSVAATYPAATGGQKTTSYTNNKPEAVKPERARPPKNDDSQSLMPLWMGLLLGAIVSGIILVMSLGSAQSNADNNITVPDVSETMTYIEAKEALNKLGLYAEVSEIQHHPTLAKGYVIAQAETAGSKAKHKDIIHLTVSKGPELISMPDFINLTRDQAIARAQGLSIELDFVEENHDEVRSGVIFEQSILKDEAVLPGSKVTLKISAGAEVVMVSVPSVVGEAHSTAMGILREAKLQSDFTQRYSESVPEGHVISQRPVAQTKVREDTLVDLVISKGPEPKPDPKPDPKPVEPEEPPETPEEPPETPVLKSIKIVVPYSDIPTDSFKIRIEYVLDGKTYADREYDDVKMDDRDQFEDIISVPVGSTWYLYINNNSSPTQQGYVQ